MHQLTAPRLLTSAEVAQRLRLSVRMITTMAEQWEDSGGHEGIPAFKIGRSWRFDPDELERWIKQRQSAILEQPAVYAALAAIADLSRNDL